MSVQMSKMSRLRHIGFTLIELLIVVIILAILAAIVIPQFSSSTTDAQEAALDANLNTMRSAIELYKVQHNNVYPGAVATSGGTCGATAGTGAANTNQAFMDSLLMASDLAGNTCSLGDTTTYRFGPYIRRSIPNDPIVQIGSTISGIVVTAAGTALAPDGAIGGWKYDTVSGQIIMNSDGVDSRGNAYSTH